MMLDALSLKMLIVQLHLLSMHLESRFASLRQVAFLDEGSQQGVQPPWFRSSLPLFSGFLGRDPNGASKIPWISRFRSFRMSILACFENDLQIANIF
jgi:hypothetical protein